MPEIEGATLAAREFACEVILTGDETVIRSALDSFDVREVTKRLHIVHASQRVEMDESPAFASRRKMDNSMSRGMQLVNDGEADAFVTAGNTGAALTNGLLIMGRIKGAKRPALAGIVPVINGRCVMLDLGANSVCKSEHLYQFGIMGSVYAQKVLGIVSPKVALLSTGEEAGKGNLLTQDAYTMLSQNSALNFVGNIEGRELFAGAADVVIADGFTGNVAIKVTEGVATMVVTMIKDAFRSSPLAMLGGTLARRAMRETQKQFDPNEYGGVPLLGLDGIAIVAHGRSNGRAIRSAINVAIEAITHDMLDETRALLSEMLTTEDNQGR